MHDWYFCTKNIYAYHFLVSNKKTNYDISIYQFFFGKTLSFQKNKFWTVVKINISEMYSVAIYKSFIGIAVKYF